MSDPTAVGEGLPPCIVRAARCEDRVALWAESGRCKCDGIDHLPVPYVTIRYGHVAPFQSKAHPEGCRDWYLYSVEDVVNPSDPAEAQAAFERGAEWVRTGSLE